MSKDFYPPIRWHRFLGPFKAMSEAPRRNWIEPMVALTMAFTTLCTAWCSYESAAWTRKSNGLMNRSHAVERRAAIIELQGNQALIVHSSMFMELIAARFSNNEKLASFYEGRFPPDVKKAYDRWMAENPFGNPAAAPHPFVPELYQIRGAAEAAAAREDGAKHVAEARVAGTAAKFEQPKVRFLAAGFGVALFLFAGVRMLLLPAV